MHELQYGHELHAFLDAVPSHLKRGRFEELRAQCQRLMREAPQTNLHKRMREALQELHLALDGQAARAYVHARYEEAMRVYEQWLSSWRKANAEAASAPAPVSLSPLIVARTLFHVSMAVLAVGLYQFVITKAQALWILFTLFSIFGTLELTRRFSTRWNQFLVESVFAPIARPRELHKTNSATWYLTALCIITTLFSREAVIAAIIVLGFGDPAAAWIGKRYGRIKLYRSKSLAGSLAFLIVSIAVAGGFLLSVSSPAPIGARALGVLAAAIAGTVAELYTTKLDDNLVVPIAAALAASIFL